MRPTLEVRRWLAFNAVGVLGFAVQLAVLTALVRGLGVHYLAATAIAVEAAILHNFCWHQRWTWRDRPSPSLTAGAMRLGRFHLLNGGVSLAGHLAIVRLLSGALGIDPIAAHLAAVVACSVVNFFGSEILVFTASRRIAAAAALVIVSAAPLFASPADSLAIELQPATLAAWKGYEHRVEERFRRLNPDGRPFFAHDEFGVPKWRDLVRGGGVAMSRIDVPAPGVARPAIPDGRVHHWAGAIFVPGISVADAVARLQEGAGRESQSYQDVIASKLLRRDGDRLTVYMKLRRESVITVVYNTEHAVDYRRLGPARAASRSVATKIAELEDPGTAREREKPPGTDRGFLWKLNAYWRYEQIDGGVVIECESISLSRGVPVLLRPFVSGVVDGIARDALEKTLASVRTVLKK